MTEDEASAEAAKRERHKSKHLRHKRWEAREQPDGSWKPALVDIAQPTVNRPNTVAFDPLVVGAVISIFGLGPTLDALRRIERENKK